MVNRVIRHLIMYDFVMNFAFGLLGPIFAVFVRGQLAGSPLKVIGTATACYWLARVLFTMPLSKFMDRTDGERDEFYFLVAGAFISATVPLMFLLMHAPWHLYLIQFIFGLANSMAVPGWRILFTDHIDAGHVGYEWSLEDIGLGIAVGASAYLGSAVADAYGFPTLLIGLSVLGYLSILLLIPLYKDAKTLVQIKQEKRLEDLRERRKHLWQ